MSSGSAGKVYFVLYLAVVLELLIIIVDRDEAEEGLRKQTQEILMIVNRILASQAPSGAQITTTPRDEITIDPTSRNKNNEERNYEVTVSVGDTTTVRGTSGFTINKFLYTLSYTRDTAAAMIPDSGDLAGIQPVIFNGAMSSEPVNILEDSLNYPVSRDYQAKRQKFRIHFKPDQPGTYRLRFKANVNQVIGVNLDPNNDREIDGSRLKDTVRIGAVVLTVKQLDQVNKMLKRNSTLVDDNMREHVTSFIDKILYGRASTLESNNGEIKFDVVVRKLEVPPSAKLEVAPQVRRFTAFVGVAIPNLIKANVKQIKFDQPQFGEFYMSSDSTWYWRWSPSAADAGKTISLVYSAHASRNAGPLDNATDTFQIQVQKLAFTDNAWFTPKFYAMNNIIPIGDTITFNRRYKDLEGVYHYELKVGGKVTQQITGQDLRFALSDDRLGQSAQLVMSFKTKEMNDFVRLDSVTLPVGPRMLYPTIPNSTLQAGQNLQISMYQGFNPQIALPAGTVITVEDDQGGKFFKKEFTMTGSPSLTIPMTPGVNVSTSTPVVIRIRSNVPNQIEDEEQLTINPRPRKR